jgi:hypothetical protein
VRSHEVVVFQVWIGGRNSVDFFRLTAAQRFMLIEAARTRKEALAP